MSVVVTEKTDGNKMVENLQDLHQLYENEEERVFYVSIEIARSLIAQKRLQKFAKLLRIGTSEELLTILGRKVKACETVYIAFFAEADGRTDSSAWQKKQISPQIMRSAEEIEAAYMAGHRYIQIHESAMNSLGKPPHFYGYTDLYAILELN